MKNRLLVRMARIFCGVCLCRRQAASVRETLFGSGLLDRRERKARHDLWQSGGYAPAATYSPVYRGEGITLHEEEWCPHGAQKAVVFRSIEEGKRIPREEIDVCRRLGARPGGAGGQRPASDGGDPAVCRCGAAAVPRADSGGEPVGASAQVCAGPFRHLCVHPAGADGLYRCDCRDGTAGRQRQRQAVAGLPAADDDRQRAADLLGGYPG